MSETTYDMPQLSVHTVYRVRNATARVFPFKHFLIEDFLDPQLFRELRALRTEGIVKQRFTIDSANPKSRAIDDPAEEKRFVLRMREPSVLSDTTTPACVKAMAELVNQKPVTLSLLRLFEDSISKRFPFMPPLENNVDLIEDHVGYRLAPHTDVPQKLVTCLIYLAEDDADPMIGTELYVLRGEHQSNKQNSARWDRTNFVRATTAPYRPNTALIFSPGKDTFHGVSPFTHAGQVRKLMQFQINVDKPAYDLKVAQWQEEQARKKGG